MFAYFFEQKVRHLLLHLGTLRLSYRIYTKTVQALCMSAVLEFNILRESHFVVLVVFNLTLFEEPSHSQEELHLH